jgi:tetratricopeptide (TPR) repeat protein
MKKTIILQAGGCTLAVLVIAGFPDRVQLQPPAQAQNQCSVESKNQSYRDFLASYEGDSRDQAKAVEAAKEYLGCPDEPSDQEEVRARLNFAVGIILGLKNSYSEAIPYFIKAASYNSVFKTSPQTYAYLGEAYLKGPYAKLSAAYERRYSGQDETEESRLAYKNILQIVDHVIDAYARAVALAGVEPPKTARHEDLRIGSPAVWMERLSELYRFRHKGSEAGLKELIATILSTPLPPEPTPITSLPPRER